jgi:hypothetical protein
MFVTSPLDLNDPFEMRPAWSEEHEKRFFQDQQMRSDLTAGLPMMAAVAGGELRPAGVMPHISPQQPSSVESQRETSDGHNAGPFRVLHSQFRVLSLVGGLFDLAMEEGESDVDATLMWSHYADQFQGICLALDTAHFDNGICEGGYQVGYPPERQSLPPSDYDCWQSLSSLNYGSPYQVDQESGLILNPSGRAELGKHRFLNLLTHKSPAWSYEHEVRMIYDLPTLASSRHYRKIEFPCETCRRKGLSPTQCEHASYRDAIDLPSEAIRAVIFGTDCPNDIVKKLLDISSGPQYSHIQLYWSSLHSERYAVQYVKSNRNYIEFMQEHRARDVAYAKRHVFRKGESLELRLCRKGINYLPPKSSASQTGEG